MAAILTTILTPLSAVLSFALRLGRNIGWVAFVLMVVVILLQIFFRYVLNNALPWPEEAARALMIWMMALIAPSAYRHAGFVSIDMLPDLLPRKMRLCLNLAIQLLALLVMSVMLYHAWAHFSAPLLFDSSGLNRLLQDTGINQLLGTEIQFRTAYIYLAMSFLSTLMILVSVELILRTAGRLVWGDDAFPEPDSPLPMEGA